VVASRVWAVAAFLVEAAPKELVVMRVAAERGCTDTPCYDRRCLLVIQRGYSDKGHSRVGPHTQSNHPERSS